MKLGGAVRMVRHDWQPINVAQLMIAQGLLASQEVTDKVLFRDCPPVPGMVNRLSQASRPIMPGDMSMNAA